MQDARADATMTERYSVKGRYWRPDLTRSEWSLLNQHMEREIGDPAHTLDEATQWAYAKEKGIRVFAIYGIGDGTEATPLYAVGGRKARAAYELLMSKMEGRKNAINGNGADISQWVNSVWSNPKYGRRNSHASGRAGATSKGIDKLHGGASGGNAEGIAGTGDRNGKMTPAFR